jgi:hypothetical protein
VRTLGLLFRARSTAVVKDICAQAGATARVIAQHARERRRRRVIRPETFLETD